MGVWCYWERVVTMAKIATSLFKVSCFCLLVSVVSYYLNNVLSIWMFDHLTYIWLSVYSQFSSRTSTTRNKVLLLTSASPSCLDVFGMSTSEDPSAYMNAIELHIFLSIYSKSFVLFEATINSRGLDFNILHFVDSRFLFMVTLYTFVEDDYYEVYEWVCLVTKLFRYFCPLRTFYCSHKWAGFVRNLLNFVVTLTLHCLNMVFSKQNVQFDDNLDSIWFESLDSWCTRNSLYTLQSQWNTLIPIAKTPICFKEYIYFSTGLPSPLLEFHFLNCYGVATLIFLIFCKSIHGLRWF